MFKLQIEVTSIEDAERILACMKHSADPAAVKQVEEQVESAASNPGGDPPADDKPRNPRGRPRRQVAEPLPESAAPASEPEATATPEAEAPASEPAQQSTYTVDDCRNALMAVQAKTPADMKPVLALLEKFGATSISRLKEADYAKFIEACKKAS